MVCLRGRKIGSCGWTQLVRSTGEVKLGGAQGSGTLGRSCDYKSSGKPQASYLAREPRDLLT